MSPLSSNARTPLKSGSALIRTHSTDFLGLHHSPAPSFPSSAFPRSKSSAALHPRSNASSNSPSRLQASPTRITTKSILRRPNSPSKGIRARFFSPRVLVDNDDQVGNESDLVDAHGNFRAREVVHEFEVDAPPSTCNPARSSVEPHHPVHATIPSSTAARRPHLPRFTIPEPVELDIEPILPCTSPSPLSSPTKKCQITTRLSRHAPVDPASTSTISCASSFFGGAQDNVSNLLEESGGFLGDDTTWGALEREHTTEQSIDLNHVAMMEVLGNKAGRLAKCGPIAPSLLRRTSNATQFDCLKQVVEETSLDVEGLLRDLKATHECSMDQALYVATRKPFLWPRLC